MSFWKWSRTASSNANADATINWAEGQLPGTVNNSARGMMAAAAKFRDDMAGFTKTTGTASAYALTTLQVMTPIAGGMLTGFTPHVTNDAGATINVDGTGAKPLRSIPGVALLPGELVEGTPYQITYNSVDDEWRIHGTLSKETHVPRGALLPFAGASAPSSSWALCYGQAISRTTYARLFDLIGTTYGAGDGSTTFNLPDLRGRVIAGQDDMGGTSANRLTALSGGVDGDVLGGTGGEQGVTIGQANLPNVNLSAASLTGSTTTTSDAAINADGVTNGNWSTGGGSRTVQQIRLGGSAGTLDSITPTLTSTTTIGGNVPLGGSGSPTNNVQPTIILNYIMRVL